MHVPVAAHLNTPLQTKHLTRKLDFSLTSHRLLEPDPSRLGINLNPVTPFLLPRAAHLLSTLHISRSQFLLRREWWQVLSPSPYLVRAARGITTISSSITTTAFEVPGSSTLRLLSRKLYVHQRRSTAVSGTRWTRSLLSSERKKKENEREEDGDGRRLLITRRRSRWLMKERGRT